MLRFGFGPFEVFEVEAGAGADEACVVLFIGMRFADSGGAECLGKAITYHWRTDRHRAGAPCVKVTETVGELLEAVSGEVVFVVEDPVW